MTQVKDYDYQARARQQLIDRTRNSVEINLVKAWLELHVVFTDNCSQTFCFHHGPT